MYFYLASSLRQKAGCSKKYIGVIEGQCTSEVDIEYEYKHIPSAPDRPDYYQGKGANVKGVALAEAVLTKWTLIVD